MPDEVREHLTRDQRPFLHPESLQILQIHSFFSSVHLTHFLQGSGQRTGMTSRSLVLCSVTHFCVVFKVCVWIIVRLEDPNMAQTCPDGGNGNFHCSSSFLKATSLICEAQLSFAAHQKYILWFLSLWWMIKGIWPLFSLLFIFLWNRKPWLDNFMFIIPWSAQKLWIWMGIYFKDILLLIISRVPVIVSNMYLRKKKQLTTHAINYEFISLLHAKVNFYI